MFINNALSAFEREFTEGLAKGLVFPVYQPIVNNDRQLMGCEILVRWRRNGIVLPPSAFLPWLHCDSTWRKLTESMIDKAVCGINQYQGQCYFSVNIPESIAMSGELPDMVRSARQRIYLSAWADKLVLEFTESIDLNRDSTAADTLQQLQQMGNRVMLDDCFSLRSVMFPVRVFNYDAYKLDMSIVNDIKYDQHARSLVLTLAYYCRLTGSDCIAEGVDTLGKWRDLQELGVSYFQGYLFSPPVELESIPVSQKIKNKTP